VNAALPEDAGERLAGASYSLERELPVHIERAFDTVVAEDVLPRVLHRVGPVPAVVETRDLTGPWDTPGSSRTVVLGNGQTVSETVVVWLRPLRFDYRVEGFGRPLGWMADYAIGSWWFEPAGRSSRFHWTYAFHARGFWTRLPLLVFVKTFWGRYMEACADRLVELAGG
jgi:hypothetical protein